MSRTGRIIGKSLKALFFLIILAVNVVVLWRVLFSGAPSSAKGLMANEKTVQAYEESGGDLQLYLQEQRTLSPSGRFAVTSCIFIPEAQQIQITVRYNNSTLKHLASDYELSNVPDRKTEVFDISIVKTVDLTPENEDDNLDPEKLRQIRYFPSDKAEEAYKTLYSYRRYIFDGIDYSDAVGLFVDVYYIGDKNYEETPYDALCIYDATMPMESKKLTAADKKVIREAAKH